MSESAGRVLMIPKGTYSPTTTYDPLDAVKYEQNSYVCKQTSRGNLPTNTTYWQPLTDVTADENPTEDSTNLVQSGGVYSALKTINQTLTSAFANNVNQSGSKNFANYDKTVTRGTSGSIGDTLFALDLEVGDKITFVCTQDNAMVSNTRNTLQVVNRANTSIKFMESNDANFHLASGLHILQFTVETAGKYNFSIWTHTLGTETTYSKFMVCDTDVYNVNPAYVPYAKTNQQLTQDSVTWDNLSEVGAVNYIRNDFRTSPYTRNGVTFTRNSDDSVTISSNSQASDWAQYDYMASDKEVSLVPGKVYKVIFKPSSITGYAPHKISLAMTERLNDNLSNLGRIYADSEPNYIEFTAKENATYNVNIGVVSGNSFTNAVTFYVMIAPVSYNGPYVPYAKTNKQLTEDTKALLDNTEVNGAVNMLNPVLKSQVFYGITVTKNGDGSYTLDGSSGNSTGTIFFTEALKLKANYSYKGVAFISGGMITGSGGTPTYTIDNHLGTQYYKGIKVNQTIVTPIFRIDADVTNYRCGIWVPTNVTFSNVIVKPMVILASIMDYAFVPYAPTNKEIGDVIKVISDIGTTVAGVHCIRQGNVVHLRINGSFNLTASQQNLIGTLPSEYRPTDNEYAMLYTSDATPSFTQLIVGSDGKLKINGWQLSGTKTLFGAATYIIR